MADDYGALAPIVLHAGSIMAAVGAITVAFKGRMRWDPVEEDVALGARKVVGLVAGTAIVILWALFRDGSKTLLLMQVAGTCGLVALLGLVVYGLLIGVYTYERERVTDPAGKVVREKVIGGLMLTKHARKTIEARDSLTVQEFFKGVAYDPDKVWTKFSRALARALLVLGFVGFVGCGTVGLASAAILLGTTGGSQARIALGTITHDEADVDPMNFTVAFETERLGAEDVLSLEVSSTKDFHDVQLRRIEDPSRKRAPFPVKRAHSDGERFVRLVLHDKWGAVLTRTEPRAVSVPARTARTE